MHPSVGATLILCAVVLAWRRPDSFLNPQFWAEDSVVFYRDAYLSGIGHFFQPYAGYLHAVPRLVAAVAVLVDPLWAPRIFWAGAFALTLYVAALTQSARLPFRRHVGYALAVVLVPDSSETLLSICNIQWVLAGGLLVLLIFRDPQKGAEYVHDFVTALVIGLTGPFSLLFAPLFIARAWLRRTRASIALAAAIVLCAAAQAWFVFASPTYPLQGAIDRLDFLRVVGMRVTASLCLGFRAPAGFSASVEVILGVGALIAVALLAIRRGAGRRERIALGAAFVLATAAGLYRCRSGLPVLFHAGLGSRYFYLPALTALWLGVAAMGDRRKGVAGVATAGILWVGFVNVTRLYAAADFPDLHWARYVSKIRAGERVDIPVNPEWVLALPARRPSAMVVLKQPPRC